MKKLLTSQQGLSLVELVVSMIILTIVLTGMLHLFSQSLLLWNLEKSHTNLEQTARIAVNSIMKELRYARVISLNSPQSFSITKISGEVNTFHLGGDLHTKTLYMVIDKQNAQPRGGISTNPLTENIVTHLVFTPYPEISPLQAILITLEVTDPQTHEKQTVHTAGYPWNFNKTLVYSEGEVQYE